MLLLLQHLIKEEPLLRYFTFFAEGRVRDLVSLDRMLRFAFYLFFAKYFLDENVFIVKQQLVFQFWRFDVFIKLNCLPRKGRGAPGSVCLSEGLLIIWG